MDIRTLPTHQGTGLTAIGWRRNGDPIWPIAGAADDGGDGADGGDDAGDGDEGDDVEGDDDEGEGEPEWTPPTKEEWEAAQARLKRANDQAKRLREQAKAAGVQPGPVKATPAKVAPAKKAVPPAAAEAEDTTPPADNGELERWQVRAIRADAKAALLAKGCDPELIDAPLSRLQPAEIDWDGDDPILEDWVEEMMERYPKAFAKQAPPPAPKAGLRKAPSIDQGAGTGGSTGQQARQRPPFGETLIAAAGGLDTSGKLRRR